MTLHNNNNQTATATTTTKKKNNQPNNQPRKKQTFIDLTPNKHNIVITIAAMHQTCIYIYVYITRQDG